MSNLPSLQNESLKNNIKRREQGNLFLPFFSMRSHNEQQNQSGTNQEIAFQALIPVITMDAKSQQVLMLAFMNEEALNKTLSTGEMHYWSRSREEIWHKGLSSGQIQTLVSLKVDCDQDALLAMVIVKGDGGCCHLGPKSCFHREVDLSSPSIPLLKPTKD